MVPITSPPTTIGTLITISQPSDLISSWSAKTAAISSMSLATKVCLLLDHLPRPVGGVGGLVPETG